MSEPVLIRNYDIIHNLFEEPDLLKDFYKLSKREINIIFSLCNKLNSFNPYIEINTKEFTESRRVVYRALDKLENEYIISIVKRPKSQFQTLQVYFTVDFIKKVCGKDYAKTYKIWFYQQKAYKESLNKNKNSKK